MLHDETNKNEIRNLVAKQIYIEFTLMVAN